MLLAPAPCPCSLLPAPCSRLPALAFDPSLALILAFVLALDPYLALVLDPALVLLQYLTKLTRPVGAEKSTPDKISALELCSVSACKDYIYKIIFSIKAYRNKLLEIKMSSKECCYFRKVFARSFNLRRHVPICMMKGQSNGFNPNTGSQEPYGDSSNQEQVSGGQEPYEHSGNQEQVSGGQEPYEDRGSQEPNEDSDMSSNKGSENNDLESHSDQISEVMSSEDARESEVKNECPWSPIQDVSLARLDDELKELITKY